MPCCAFAAFILSQILIGLAAVKKFVLNRQRESDELASNPATEWRLGFAGDRAAVAPLRSWRGWTLRGLAVAASLEIALVLGAAWGVHLHRHHHHHATPVVETVAQVSNVSTTISNRSK